jgi:hypothetical protein
MTDNLRQEIKTNKNPHSSFGNTKNISPMLQSTITNLLGMGFEQEEILRSLKASSGNPDLAVEYLLTGNPDDFKQKTDETSKFSNNNSIPQIPRQQFPIVQQENNSNQNPVYALNYFLVVQLEIVA